MEAKVYGKIASLGFNIETDVSTETAEAMQDEYVILQNMFAEIMNGSLEKINSIWEKHEMIARRDTFLGNNGYYTNMSLKAMELEPGADYDDWLFKWTLETLEQIKDYSDRMNFSIEMKCIRIDHKNWTLIGEYKKNPKWLIWFKKD